MKMASFSLLLLLGSILPGQSRLISFEDLEVRQTEDNKPVYYYKSHPFTGKTYDYHERENVSLEHHLANGLLTLKEGFRDGKKIEYAEFKQGILDGVYLKFFGNGQQYVEHHYQKGKMHGRQMGWTRDGQLRFVSEYRDGIEQMRVNYPPPGGFETLIRN